MTTISNDVSTPHQKTNPPYPYQNFIVNPQFLWWHNIACGNARFYVYQYLDVWEINDLQSYFCRKPSLKWLVAKIQSIACLLLWECLRSAIAVSDNQPPYKKFNPHLYLLATPVSFLKFFYPHLWTSFWKYSSPHLMIGGWYYAELL